MNDVRRTLPSRGRASILFIFLAGLIGLVVWVFGSHQAVNQADLIALVYYPMQQTTLKQIVQALFHSMLTSKHMKT